MVEQQNIQCSLSRRERKIHIIMYAIDPYIASVARGMPLNYDRKVTMLLEQLRRLEKQGDHERDKETDYLLQIEEQYIDKLWKFLGKREEQEDREIMKAIQQLQQQQNNSEGVDDAGKKRLPHNLIENQSTFVDTMDQTASASVNPNIGQDSFL
ncbi:hypothetical protein FGO68_gene12320 [Halteria grandinella]|uniref:Uncharacterized protein n=1 Tax=Halteria grandinella TaxID=5974 RepID=A0A8J8T6D7_HALGN|nr:hypothetical protein FGO68_gene12320 [Halteria grandinella]